MLRFVDRNNFLFRLLTAFSKRLAANRGLPMVAGAALTLISWLVTGIVLIVIVSDASIDSIWLLLCLPATLLHLGVFVGFIGFMLSVPLGPGYKE